MEIKINWTLNSKEDLKEIYEFINGNSPFYADLEIDKIYTSVELLNDHKNIGRVVPEIGLEYIREIIEGNYRIIYMLVADNQIDIITIHHTSKELKIVDFL